MPDLLILCLHYFLGLRIICFYLANGRRQSGEVHQLLKKSWPRSDLLQISLLLIFYWRDARGAENVFLGWAAPSQSQLCKESVDYNGANINHHQIHNLRGGNRKRLWDLLPSTTWSPAPGRSSQPHPDHLPTHLPWFPAFGVGDHKFDSFEGKENLA